MNSQFVTVFDLLDLTKSMVRIRSPRILSRNNPAGGANLAGVCCWSTSRSQFRSRWRIPTFQSFQASRICGYAAIHLALFTAQCRHLTKRRLQGCLPVWILPWLLLLLCLIVLPGTPALLNFCAICIGHNYSHSFIEMVQGLEAVNVLTFIPTSAYIPTSSRLRLPTYSSSQMSTSPSQFMYEEHAIPPVMMDRLTLNHHLWEEPQSVWRPESEVLEEQMLRAGILASLQDAPDEVNRKVVVPKSSVSALRLQQLEKMGFPTEKAVVALAASKQLDGAISLLIDDRVGEQAVVVAKGKKTTPPKEDP
ncbi:rhomboid domain-containing protein 3 isoform X4 [Vanacampus margaritifer]